MVEQGCGRPGQAGLPQQPASARLQTGPCPSSSEPARPGGSGLLEDAGGQGGHPGITHGLLPARDDSLHQAPPQLTSLNPNQPELPPGQDVSKKYYSAAAHEVIRARAQNWPSCSGSLASSCWASGSDDNAYDPFKPVHLLNYHLPHNHSVAIGAICFGCLISCCSDVDEALEKWDVNNHCWRSLKGQRLHA